jgi:hypothetical protein
MNDFIDMIKTCNYCLSAPLLRFVNDDGSEDSMDWGEMLEVAKMCEQYVKPKTPEPTECENCGNHLQFGGRFCSLLCQESVMNCRHPQGCSCHINPDLRQQIAEAGHVFGSIDAIQIHRREHERRIRRSLRAARMGRRDEEKSDSTRLREAYKRDSG